MRRVYVIFAAILLTGVQMSCSSMPQANTAPVPGNSGSINFEQSTTNTGSLSWTMARDSSEDQSQLLYKVVFSTQDTINTVDDALVNGTIGLNWTVNIQSCVLSNLSSGTRYYFNVLVKNSNGNISSYTAQEGYTQLRGDVAVGPVFLDMLAGGTAPAPVLMKNGTVAVVYGLSTPYEKYLTFYDQQGQRLLAPVTIFDGDRPVSVSALPDGNVMVFMSSIMGGASISKIYSPLGSLVSTHTNSYITPENFSILKSCTLANGYIALAAISDDGSSFYYFDLSLIDQSGDIVSNISLFGSMMASVPYDIVALENSDALLVYGHSSKGKLNIYTPQGVAVRTNAVFHDGSILDVSAVRMSDGNIFLTYLDSSDSQTKYMILTADGFSVHQLETLLYAGVTYYQNSVLLQDGRILVTFRDNSDSDKGKYMIISADGTQIEVPATEYSPLVNDRSELLALPNGKMMVLQKDVTNSSMNRLEIWQ